MSAPHRKGQGSDAGSNSESANASDRFSPKYAAYDGADWLVEEEGKYLKWWRGPEEPLVGLALSGGGIRSATYCLGVLQALAHEGVLPEVDYLSTVSGGGYIGSSMTYLLHQSASGSAELPKFDVSKKNFPYVSYPMVGVGEAEQVPADAAPASEGSDIQSKHAATGDGAFSQEVEKLKGRLLRRLRQSSNYLMPGDGITLLSLTGVVLRNLAAGLAVHVALLVLVFQLLFWPTWVELDKPLEGAAAQRGSVASVWPAGDSKGRPATNDTQSAPAQVQSTTAETKSVSTVVTTGANAAPATTSEVTSVTTGTQSTITAATARPAKRFFVPAPNGFLRLAGNLLCAFALVSALYLFATRFFDAMERKPRQPTDSKGGVAPAEPKSGKRFGPYWVRHLYERSTHWLLLVAIALLVVGGIPWVHAVLAQNSLLSQLPKLLSAGETGPLTGGGTGVVATLIGVIGNVWGFLQARSGKKPLIPTGLVVGVASAALFFGLLLLVYILTGWMHLHWVGNEVPRIVVGSGLVLLLIGWLPEANYASLHRYYRDRLLELFLPDLEQMNQNLRNDDTRYLPLHLFLWNGFRRWLGALGRQTAQYKAVYARIPRSIPGDATMLADVCGAKRFREKPGPANCDAAAVTGTLSASERAELKKRGPYHIVNSNLVLVASQDPRFRPRGGDNFIFSPLYCGSRATGWMPTEPSPQSGPTLATAMAISGAAVNPNAGPDGRGITRQPALSVLMGLLNLRLGYWVRNPRLIKATIPGDSSPAAAAGGQAGSSKRLSWVKPNAIYPGLLESFGRFNLNEHARYLLLTDGGHFENLGLYELVRRRLKLIIVCDATADPSFKFTDLSNAIQKVRADFGAIIDVSAEQLATLVPPPPDAATSARAGKDDRKKADAKEGEAGPKAAARGHLIVPIRYSKRLWCRPDGDEGNQSPPGDADDRNETGTLILLKATACRGLPADLFSYRRDHPEFPNEGTVDQFFDERQFDAYRELGFHTALQMLTELSSEAPGLAAAFESTNGYRPQTRYEVARLLFGRSP